MGHLYFLKHQHPAEPVAILAHPDGDNWHVTDGPCRRTNTFDNFEFHAFYTTPPAGHFRLEDGTPTDPNRFVTDGTHTLTFCTTEEEAANATSPDTYFFDIDTGYTIKGRTPTLTTDDMGTVQEGQEIPIVGELRLPVLAAIPTNNH